VQSPFAITRVASYGETLYVHGPGRLTIFDGTRFGARNVWNWPVEKVWDWGELPSLNTRDILSLGSRLYIATDRGLGVLRGMSLTQLRGEQVCMKTRPVWRAVLAATCGSVRRAARFATSESFITSPVNAGYPTTM
jgi:hypothetical protein